MNSDGADLGVYIIVSSDYTGLVVMYTGLVVMMIIGSGLSWVLDTNVVLFWFGVRYYLVALV